MKKTLSILLMVILISTSSFMTFATVSNASIGTDTVIAGTVSLQINSVVDSKMLVLIEKEGVKYTYPVDQSNENAYFPLQMGNGDYTVRLMENIEGNRYKELTREQVNLNLEDENVLFLNSIQDINWNADSLAVKKAFELTKGLVNDESKIKAIYNYVTRNFKYDYAKVSNLTSAYVPNVELVYASKLGICYDYSSLFASMLRSVGVPTKLIKGYSVNTGSTYHAWNEVYVNGVWKVIDTTSDAAYVQKKLNVSLYKNAFDYSTSKTY